jgi:3-methylfumaryl-CoA hydratase
MTQTEDRFAEWIGRKTQAADVLTERLAASFHALFGTHLAPCRGGEAPIGIHWCLCPAIAAMEDLGGDGHPAKNRDLPPVPLPRRMWAGGSVQHLAPLRVGDRVTRASTIAAVTHKSGRSGELCFVEVVHEYSTSRGVAIRERQDIVYREAAKSRPSVGGKVSPRPAAPRRRFASTRTIMPSPMLLFRYSALTFNSHRIHYDFPFATEVEGYPGLVVHGPLQATLLLNHATAGQGHPPAGFDYRALAAAFADCPLTICAGVDGQAGAYWTEGPSGTVHMEAKSANSE